MNKKYNAGDTVFVKGRVTSTILNDKYWVEVERESTIANPLLVQEQYLCDNVTTTQDEVWDFFTKIYTDYTDENRWYQSYPGAVTDRYTSYEEAKKAFEKWKSQIPKPEVGDVYTSKDAPRIRFIITKVNPSGDEVSRLWNNGDVDEISWDSYKISRRYAYSFHKNFLTDLLKEE